jgi:hypothetical protein
MYVVALYPTYLARPDSHVLMLVVGLTRLRCHRFLIGRRKIRFRFVLLHIFPTTNAVLFATSFI